jgi:hypothetical protein
MVINFAEKAEAARIKAALKESEKTDKEKKDEKK